MRVLYLVRGAFISAIAKAMPEQMEKYNIEVQLATKAYQEK